jgi:hypothetical protein
MTVALSQIRRVSDEIWCWMVEFDNPNLGRSGRATSYAAADQIVRDIIGGKV